MILALHHLRFPLGSGRESEYTAALDNVDLTDTERAEIAAYAAQAGAADTMAAEWEALGVSVPRVLPDDHPRLVVWHTLAERETDAGADHARTVLRNLRHLPDVLRVILWPRAEELSPRWWNPDRDPADLNSVRRRRLAHGIRSLPANVLQALREARRIPTFRHGTDYLGSAAPRYAARREAPQSTRVRPEVEGSDASSALSPVAA